MDIRDQLASGQIEIRCFCINERAEREIESHAHYIVQVGALTGVGPVSELERVRVGERLEVPGMHLPHARPRVTWVSRVHVSPSSRASTCHLGLARPRVTYVSWRCVD